MVRLEVRCVRASLIVGVSVLGLSFGPGPHPARAQTLPVVRPDWAWAVLGVDLATALRPFPVRGRNLGEVRRHLASEGPVTTGGSRGEAMTTYKVSVHWKARAGAGGCRVAEARALAEITIDLPVWVDAGRASNRDVIAWQEQRQGLYAHEQEHRDAVLRAAYAVVNEVRAQVFDDCPGLSRQVGAAIERVKQDLMERQDRIDAHRRASAYR